jgi:quercetin dioxygenase-like cupin family protein
MAATTPNLSGIDKLGALASRYVNVNELPWKPTRWAGIDMKVLIEEPDTGLMTALFRWAPGSELPYHEHVRIEQTFVLEGSFEDEEGECSAGNFVWRPQGSRHVARSPKGALMIGFFLAPNTFLTEAQPTSEAIVRSHAAPSSAWSGGK